MFGPNFVNLFTKIFSKHIAPKIHDHMVHKLSNSTKFQEFVRKTEGKVEDLSSNAPGKAKAFGGHFFEELKNVLREMNPFSKRK